MASGTTSTAIKKRFARRWISRHCRSIALALQNSQIFHERTNRRRIKTVKRRHAASRNSIRDDLCKPCVRSILSFRRRCDVRRAFPAPTVESVTPGAPVFECLPRFRDRTLTLRWVILRRGCTFDVESENEKGDSKRNECESFESKQ